MPAAAVSNAAATLGSVVVVVVVMVVLLERGEAGPTRRPPDGVYSPGQAGPCCESRALPPHDGVHLVRCHVAGGDLEALVGQEPHDAATARGRGAGVEDELHRCHQPHPAVLLLILRLRLVVDAVTLGVRAVAGRFPCLLYTSDA